MGINLHLTSIKTRRKKIQKKNLKKKISKKNPSATFHILSKCHFLSNGEGVCSQQAISGHPSQPTLNYRKNTKKKKSKKKFKKKNSKKSKSNSEKKSKKILSATFQIFSKCHFLSHGEDVSGHQAVNGHPYQLTSN